MVYTFFSFTAFLPNFTRLLQSYFGTHVLYNSWNSCIASDLPSVLSKVAIESKKYQFKQFAAGLANFGKLLQSLKVAAGH